VVIVGATSKQGSSVVCSLLQSGRFTVKALTQDSNSPGARWPASSPSGHAVLVSTALDACHDSATPANGMPSTAAHREHARLVCQDFVCAADAIRYPCGDWLSCGTLRLMWQGHRISRSGERRSWRGMRPQPPTCIGPSRCGRVTCSSAPLRVAIHKSVSHSIAPQACVSKSCPASRANVYITRMAMALPSSGGDHRL